MIFMDFQEAKNVSTLLYTLWPADKLRENAASAQHVSPIENSFCPLEACLANTFILGSCCCCVYTEGIEKNAGKFFVYLLSGFTKSCLPADHWLHCADAVMRLEHIMLRASKSKKYIKSEVLTRALITSSSASAARSKASQISRTGHNYKQHI